MKIVIFAAAGAELHRGEPQPGPGGHQQRLHGAGEALQAAVHSGALSSLHHRGSQTRHQVCCLVLFLNIYLFYFTGSHCQNTYNTTLYQRLHRKLADTVAGTANGAGASAAAGGGGGPSAGGGGGGADGNLPDVAVGAADQGVGERSVPALDLTWVDTRNKKFQLKLEKLDNDLKNYKSNSIKESIRRGHDDLGDHFLDG